MREEPVREKIGCAGLNSKKLALINSILESVLLLWRQYIRVLGVHTNDGDVSGRERLGGRRDRDEEDDGDQGIVPGNIKS